MRIVLKGGVWKNTEDEILKVAVMKYGKNQWSRISSLLTRKTPKQCKARWYEWLDPSIKKTEWAKEEDEKLLHLAKLMPTQWRTIAPIVERTPAQCLERYQRLLDDAERELAGTYDGGVSSSSSQGADFSGHAASEKTERRVRQGEIDPDPETKPARPDPVDMDEDEKEMLSEARARLANTQGKKAKRKARERQLEESHRLAALQKRREIKAAGLVTGDSNFRMPKGKDDWNRDIPFQRLPLPGFYDTSRELSQKTGRTFAQIMLSQADGKRKAESEAQLRLLDAKRRRNNSAAATAAGTKSGLPVFVAARDAGASSASETNKIFDSEMSAKRAPLVLPQPHVTLAEIEQLSKLGASQVPLDNDSDLVSNYSGTPYLPVRTSCVPLADSLRAQARALAIAKSMQTPLLGETDHSSSTPSYITLLQATPSATSSICGTPLMGGSSVSNTPMPLCDRMGINTPSQASVMDQTPRERQMRAKNSRNQLLDALQALPTPRNDFQIVAPFGDGDDPMVGEGDGSQHALLSNELLGRRPDQGDVGIQQSANTRRLAAENLERRSQVLVRGLPRPRVVPSVEKVLLARAGLAPGAAAAAVTAGGFCAADLLEAQKMIATELCELLRNDNDAYPDFEAAVPVATAVHAGAHETEVEIEWLRMARAEVAKECTRGLFCAPNKTQSVRLVFANYVPVLCNPADGMLLDRNCKSAQQMAQLYAGISGAVLEAATSAGKAEKKLAVKFGGYEQRGLAVSKRIDDLFSELRTVAASFESIRRLRESELVAIPIRINSVKERLVASKQQERELQTLYRDHVEKRNRLLLERHLVTATN